MSNANRKKKFLESLAAIPADAPPPPIGKLPPKETKPLTREEAATARVKARNEAIDRGVAQLDQQINAHMAEANKLNAVKQELLAEKAENLKAIN